VDHGFLTIDEVMNELEISRRTVFNLVRRGKLTKLRAAVGRKRTYFIATQVRVLKKPVPFDPSSASDDEMRRLNEEFDQAMRAWLAEQPTQSTTGQ
jgi:hypothetical protein